jgi:uncharacterized membrane protein YraQ (UPF0718 family)
MPRTSIPAYAVCGASAALRQAFFAQFCRNARPLLVGFGGQAAGPEAQGVCLVPADEPPLAAGERIAGQLKKGAYDALWILWEDALPIERLLTLMRAPGLTERCRLRKIVRCGDGEADIAALGGEEGLLARQLAQCDLFAATQTDRRAIAGVRRRIRPLQPDIEVIAWDDRREIGAVLGGRNVLQGVRFLFVLVAVGAVLAALNRLQFSLPDTLATFLGTYLQALPFLLLGILLSAAIQVFVPAGLLQRVFPKKLLPGMLFGVLGGFVMPICDCASIPVFRSLVRKGVPLPAAVTFMIAAPIINPVVMLSTYYAFGANPRVMFTRMGFGVVCSVLVGLCFAWDRKSALLTGAAAPVCACGAGHGDACGCGHHEHGGPDGQETTWHPRGTHAHGGLKRKACALIAHFRDEFFEVVRYLLFGIGVSTVLQLVLGGKLTSLRFDDLAASMLVMMAMAFLLSLCSSSDAVVGKNMGASLPMGAVMSFMVFGPMIDVKNVALMASSFTRRFMLKLLIATFAVSFITVYAAFSLGLGALIA